MELAVRPVLLFVREPKAGGQRQPIGDLPIDLAECGIDHRQKEDDQGAGQNEERAGREPAPVAQALYEETLDSIRLRVQAQAQKALAPEPAQSIDGGRPTKRERRAIDRWREAG